jgi:hypothetical protein
VFAMDLPFTLPAWLPWWVPIVLLVPALLYALAFLFMPFSVIGVKSRLEMVEARLDEIQHEIRQLVLRLPAPGAHVTDFDEVYSPPAIERRREAPVVSRPPIPPAPRDIQSRAEYDAPPTPAPMRAAVRDSARNPARRESVRHDPGGHPGRAEPRLNWPRSSPDRS